MIVQVVIITYSRFVQKMYKNRTNVNERKFFIRAGTLYKIILQQFFKTVKILVVITAFYHHKIRTFVRNVLSR